MIILGYIFSFPLESVCRKCQTLFSVENKKKTISINMSSAENINQSSKRTEFTFV